MLSIPYSFVTLFWLWILAIICLLKARKKGRCFSGSEQVEEERRVIPGRRHLPCSTVSKWLPTLTRAGQERSMLTLSRRVNSSLTNLLIFEDESYTEEMDESGSKCVTQNETNIIRPQTFLLNLQFFSIATMFYKSQLWTFNFRYDLWTKPSRPSSTSGKQMVLVRRFAIP